MTASLPRTGAGLSPPVQFAAPGSLRAVVLEELRVVVVVGVGLGALVGGLGGRLAMFVLRLTSPASVDGVISDDGFEIGRVTLGGTYNLLSLGAALGMIGVVAYQLVAPWLLGPDWFRHVTVALGSGAVVGSMLLHGDGVDFTLLEPVNLAIALFVALPALFGLLVGPAVAACRRPGAWVNASAGRRGMVPLVLLALFPLVLFAFAVIAVAVAAASVFAASGVPARLRDNPAVGMAVRALWLGIALAGLVALIDDIDAITTVA